jgi:hypothetical protein
MNTCIYKCLNGLSYLLFWIYIFHFQDVHRRKWCVLCAEVNINVKIQHCVIIVCHSKRFHAEEDGFDMTNKYSCSKTIYLSVIYVNCFHSAVFLHLCLLQHTVHTIFSYGHLENGKCRFKRADNSDHSDIY